VVAQVSRILILSLVAICAGWPAHAAELKRVQLSDGTEIEYALVLPARFSEDKRYPAILAFPGGRQTLESVKGGLARFWEHEAAKRGYIVFQSCRAAGKTFP